MLFVLLKSHKQACYIQAAYWEMVPGLFLLYIFAEGLFGNLFAGQGQKHTRVFFSSLSVEIAK